MQKTSCQTDEFIAGGDDVEAGRAAAQGDQLDWQSQLVEIKQAQKGISQPDCGEHRIVLAEATMGSDVNEATRRPFVAQNILACILADKQVRVVENAGERLNLV